VICFDVKDFQDWTVAPKGRPSITFMHMVGHHHPCPEFVTLSMEVMPVVDHDPGCIGSAEQTTPEPIIEKALHAASAFLVSVVFRFRCEFLFDPGNHLAWQGVCQAIGDDLPAVGGIEMRKISAGMPTCVG
jgi:hypothetical protein